MRPLTFAPEAKSSKSQFGHSRKSIGIVNRDKNPYPFKVEILWLHKVWVFLVSQPRKVGLRDMSGATAIIK